MRNKNIRIAFAAKQRSGKDVAAEYILSLKPGKILKFAAPLYELMYIIQDYCNFPHSKDRELLQYLGTDFVRAKDENFWVNLLFSNLDLAIAETLIITDARFHNEFLACKKNGFILVKIETLESIRIERGACSIQHPSEIDMDEYTDYDYIIQNNGSLEDFKLKLSDLIYSIENS